MDSELPGNRCNRCPVGTECPFCGLTGEARRAFQEAAEVRYYAPDAVLMRQGERPSGLFIVRSGVVRLHHDDPDGHSLVLGLVGPAGLLGLSEVVTGGPSMVTVRTLQHTRAEVVPRSELVRFLMEFPETTIPLLVKSSEEMQRLREELLAALHSRPLPERLLNRLRTLADACGVPTEQGDVLIDLPLTVSDVGESVGCSRQWASRLLGEAEEEGLIERRDGRIVLTASALTHRSRAGHPEERELEAEIKA